MPTKHITAIRATRNFAASKPATAKKRQEQRIIILDDLDFTWTAGQIRDFRAMWKAGISLPDMARKLRRDPDEVALLVMHEARQGTIELREGGWMGG